MIVTHIAMLKRSRVGDGNVSNLQTHLSLIVASTALSCALESSMVSSSEVLKP
jgi:hypothetical protein